MRLVLAMAMLCASAGRTDSGTVSEWHAGPGWFINGVRPNGRYEALPVLGRPERDLDDAHERREIRDSRSIVGWVWCWRPETPRQDGQRVWCAP